MFGEQCENKYGNLVNKPTKGFTTSSTDDITNPNQHLIFLNTDYFINSGRTNKYILEIITK